MRDDDDGYGQDDGEHVGWAQFQPRTPAAGMPWLKQPNPPWHLWGSAQTVELTRTFGGPPAGALATPQLARVAYGRPESWHWLFSAVIVDAQPAVAGVDPILVTVRFGVVPGIGRSSVQLRESRASIGYPAGQNVPFEEFSWAIAPAAAIPVGLRRWSTTSHGPPRTDTDVSSNVISELVFQDMQCDALVAMNVVQTQRLVVEVAAFFAPKNHIRPDWFQERAPPEVKFPGGELPAR